MNPGSAKLILLGALLSLTACAGLPARGIVGGQTIDSRVDSEAARYYLQNYLAGKHGDAALDERIDNVYRRFNGRLPDRGELKRLSDDFSLDFATLYFADRIARIAVNRRFRNAFDQARNEARKAFPQGLVRLPAQAREFEAVFVPGYLYKRLPLLGTNFAAPRAALKRVGLAHYFVETKEDGAIEANADLVAAAIRARAQSGRRLILISASKSGPEVALALTKLASSETRHVAAWINAVGALQGSPLADERLLPEVVKRAGEIDVAGVESMTTERSRKRFASFNIPEQVLVVNYIGVPVSGSISSLGGLGFSYMKKFGPSDGITLLPDAIFPGGVILAELGRDHFLLDSQIDVTTVALMTTVIRWLEEYGGKISPSQETGAGR
jgi:hypothetical protein